MFGLKKDVDSNIYAPADGRLITLKDVPDQVFTSKVLEGGAAIEVTSEEICAPCSGRLIILTDTRHAFGISADNGIEVLVHTGLDAVEFNGTGFTVLEAVNDRAKRGTPTIRLDREFSQSQNACLITPALIPNSAGYPFMPETIGKGVVTGESVVIRFQQRRERVIQVIEKINNNVMICLGNNDHELITFGHGVGFPPTPYELNDASKIDRIYYGVSSSYLGLINGIPENIFEVSIKIVDMTVNYIDYELSSDLVFTLTDHINFTTERNRANMGLKNPFLYDIQYFYEKGMDIGSLALKMIRRYLRVDLPEEEAENVALHFISTEALNEKDKEFNFSNIIIEEVTHLVEKKLDIRIRREDFNYSRFVSHLRYLIKRRNTAGNTSSDSVRLCMEMEQEFPQTYQCVLKVRNYMVKKLEWELNEEEQLYLILRVSRPYAREDYNR